jgi:hypothetical protein
MVWPTAEPFAADLLPVCAAVANSQSPADLRLTLLRVAHSLTTGCHG